MRSLLLISSCLVAGFMIIPYQVKCQDSSSIKITESFENQSLNQIFEALQDRYQIHFYFPIETPLNQVKTVNFDNNSLDHCMTVLLTGTPLGYMYYRDYAVIIAQKALLGSGYSTNYYQAWEERMDAKPLDSLTVRPTVVGELTQMRPDEIAQLSGILKDEDTGEVLAGASVSIPELQIGSVTDKNGQFSFQVPVGKHDLQVQYLGYELRTLFIQVYSNGSLPIPLRKEAITLDEVVLEAQTADANVSNAQIGVTRLDVKMMKRLPAFMGEVDVVKTLLLQPGVSTVGEGESGFHVRGGNADQNLILIDEALIFNSSHALGFFSTFNTDLVGDISLYKGNIPATFGGRLASVLDINMRDGIDHFRIQGGVGPISSRISVEGPLVKNKSTFIAGIRSSYSDWILQRVNIPEVKASSAFFYDANFRYSHEISDKDRFTISAYSSKDDFTFADEFGFGYQTQHVQGKYTHLFNNQFSLTTSAVVGEYQSSQTDLNESVAAQLDNRITYGKGKLVLANAITDKLTISGGVSSIYYSLQPGDLFPTHEQSAVIPRTLENEQGLESAVFVQEEWEISQRFVISGGLRFSYYQYLGAKSILNYDPNRLPEISSIIDTTFYGAGTTIADYTSLEPRISFRLSLTPETSFKMGYSRTAQFINQISNTTNASPTQIWQLSTPYIEPQRSHNLSAGIFHNFQNDKWESSIEGYYRDIDKAFDYRDFADLVANTHIETELLPGKGRAYGLELSMRKPRGFFNGWLSYTLSRTERKTPGINGGNWYAANFDRPHDLTMVANLQFNRRHSLSFNFTYQSGRPLTVPVGSYISQNGLSIPDYSLRNQYRIPDYHRLDIAYTVGRGYKKSRKVNTSWTFSIYNVYSRRNPYSIFFTQGVFQDPTAQRVSILGSAFPSLTFNFETL